MNFIETDLISVESCNHSWPLRPSHWGSCNSRKNNTETALTLIHSRGHVRHLIPEVCIKPASKDETSVFNTLSAEREVFQDVFLTQWINHMFSSKKKKKKKWWEVHILQVKARSLLSGALVLKISNLTGELSSQSWNDFMMLWSCAGCFFFLNWSNVL